jgi:hypothetical protein
MASSARFHTFEALIDAEVETEACAKLARGFVALPENGCELSPGIDAPPKG